jgi:hypothetical protein
VHTPVAKSTLCTADDLPSWILPPRRSTCPWSLSLSSTATVAELSMRPHDNGSKTSDLQGVLRLEWADWGVGPHDSGDAVCIFEL